MDAIDGDVAQPGEHLLCKQGVVGSNPIVSTKCAAGREGPVVGYHREATETGVAGIR